VEVGLRGAEVVLTKSRYALMAMSATVFGSRESLRSLKLKTTISAYDILLTEVTLVKAVWVKCRGPIL
jgi:hypothetical protein